MLKRLEVKNFRSIEECDLELGPVTVLFGSTAAGKSSLLYALLCLRNFVLNPNQQVDGLFNLGFQNLGGFEACVYNHDPSKTMSIVFDYWIPARGAGTYGVSFSKNGANIFLRTLGRHELKTGPIPLPYSLSPVVTHTFVEGGDANDANDDEASDKAEEQEGDEQQYLISWNGISSTVAADPPTADSQAAATRLATTLNTSVEALRRVDIAPHRRGFFKPTYSAAPPSATPTTEDDVASILINDMNLPPKVSASTEEIFGRDFRTHTPPGTAITYFQTTDKKARMPVFLVNDGFGINQVVYILAKAHRVDVDTLLVEEPEVHLHPSVVRKFARELCDRVREDGKQIILTTHSETFLVALLASVREGKLPAKDLVCYYVNREFKTSTFVRQQVHDNGQMEGGLAAFLEAEMADLKSFLGS